MNRMNQRGGIAAVLLMTLGIVVLVEGVQFLAQGSDYFLYRLFAPRQEAVRREVFEQSRAFNEGMAQELWDMQVQYNRAEPNGRAALRSIILHRVAGYDMTRLDPGLLGFVLGLRAEETGGIK